MGCDARLKRGCKYEPRPAHRKLKPICADSITN